MNSKQYIDAGVVVLVSVFNVGIVARVAKLLFNAGFEEETNSIKKKIGNCIKAIAVVNSMSLLAYIIKKYFT